MPRKTLEDRFWAKVNRRNPGQCWPWTGMTQRGYGYLKVRGVRARAHRIAWELAHGRRIPEGMVIRHRCDRPACCNPAHLALGTHADNVADRVARGRSRYVHGERHGGAKLSEQQVGQLREMYAAGGIRQADLAQRFGVSQGTVSHIVNRKGWIR